MRTFCRIVDSFSAMFKINERDMLKKACRFRVGEKNSENIVKSPMVIGRKGEDETARPS